MIPLLPYKSVLVGSSLRRENFRRSLSTSSPGHFSLALEKVGKAFGSLSIAQKVDSDFCACHERWTNKTTDQDFVLAISYKF